MSTDTQTQEPQKAEPKLPGRGLRWPATQGHHCPRTAQDSDHFGGPTATPEVPLRITKTIATAQSRNKDGVKQALQFMVAARSPAAE